MTLDSALVSPRNTSKPMILRTKSLFAAAVLFSLAVPPSLAHADPAPVAGKKDKKDKDKKDKEDKDKPNPNEPPTVKTDIKLVPEGMKWGHAKADMEKLVEKFIDDDYKPKYKDAGSNSSKLKDLDNEVAAKKSAFKRSTIDLVVGPSGLDANAISPEFSKGNGEMLMSHQRGPGVKIWFFFIGGRLWKTLEEVNFEKGGLYGEDIGGAVKLLVDGVGGTMPRQVPANPDKKQFQDVFDWQDKDTHMRIWDRSGTLVIVREERTTVGNLVNLRKASAAKKDAIDPSVAAFLRVEPPAPPAPPANPPKK